MQKEKREIETGPCIHFSYECCELLLIFLAATLCLKDLRDGRQGFLYRVGHVRCPGLKGNCRKDIDLLSI